MLDVAPKVGHVRYGSLRVKLLPAGAESEESLATFTTLTGVGEGFHCAVHLKPQAYVALKPGVNRIALEWSDTWNNDHREEFTVVLKG